MMSDALSPTQRLNQSIQEIQSHLSRSLNNLQGLKDFLNNGASEKFVAGEHQGRYLLELLQNARDAAAKDLEGNLRTPNPEGQFTPPRRALFLFTPKGILIANTGSPFHLDHLKTLEAIRRLDSSTKESEMSSIGHKGVGMKSLRLHADAFSVVTRLGDGGEEAVRVDFSLRRTAEFCLENANAVIRAELLTGLPKLPLFYLPFFDSTSRTLSDGEAPLRALLELCDLGEDQWNQLPKDVREADFVTIIALWFKEERNWPAVLDAAYQELGNLTEDPEKKAGLLSEFISKRKALPTRSDTRLDTLWEHAVNPIYEDYISPETIVLMDGLEEMGFLRLNGPDTVHDCRYISIQRQPCCAQHGADLLHIVVTENQGQQKYILAKPSAEAEDDECAPRLLFPLQPIQRGEQSRNCRLHLYYPIKNQPSGLPFFVHGLFQVTPSRTNLNSEDEEKERHNQKVIEGALQLFKNCLPHLAGIEEMRPCLPWALLPPQASSAQGVEGEIERLILKGAVDILRNSTWVPVTGGWVKRPAEVFLMPEDDLRPAFALFYEFKGADQDFILIDRQSWQKRGEYPPTNQAEMEQAGFGTGFAGAFFTALSGGGWQKSLGDGPIRIPEEAGEKAGVLLLRAVMKLLSLPSNEAWAAKLGEANALLLPVKIDKQNYLVRAHKYSNDGEEQKQRVVFYFDGAKLPEEEAQPEMPASDIRVYFFPMDAGIDSKVLKNYSKAWGMNVYTSREDLFRRISERMDELTENHQGNVAEFQRLLGYLAGLLNAIDPRSGSDLFPRAYTHIDLNLLKDAILNKEYAREQLERKQGWLRIGVPIESGGLHSAGETVFGSAWADLLKQAGKEELTWYARLIETNPDRSSPCILPPDLQAWQAALEVMKNWQPEEFQSEAGALIGLFRLLLLLGVRVGPNVEWRWLTSVKDKLKEEDRCISREVMRVPGSGLPKIKELDGELYQAYGRWTLTNPYHYQTTLSFGDFYQYRNRIKKEDIPTWEWLAAITWFPMLLQEPEVSAIIPWLRVLLSVRMEDRKLSCGDLFDTGWRSFYGDAPLIWHTPIPSFAWYQITHTRLWPAQENPEERLPACALIRDAESGLPDLPHLFKDGKEHPEEAEYLADALQIYPCQKNQNEGALHIVERLNWLLERQGSAWNEPTARELLNRITNLDPSGTAYSAIYQSCELRLPAVYPQTHEKIVIGYSDRKKLKFLNERPQEWQKDRLKRDNNPLFLYDAQALPDDLAKWAGGLNLVACKVERESVTLSGEVAEEDQRLLEEMKEKILDRAIYILGYLKHNERKDLAKTYQEIVTAITEMRVTDQWSEGSPLGKLNGKENILLMSKDSSQALPSIAYGLAVKLQVESLKSSFFVALQAEKALVEKMLEIDGVDLGELSLEIPELANPGVLLFWKANQLLDRLGLDRLPETTPREEQMVLQTLANQLGFASPFPIEALDGEKTNSFAPVRTLSDWLIQKYDNDLEAVEKLLYAAFPNLQDLLWDTPEAGQFLYRLALAEFLFSVEVDNWQGWRAKIHEQHDTLKGKSLIFKTWKKRLSTALSSEGFPDLMTEWTTEHWQAQSKTVCEEIEKYITQQQDLQDDLKEDLLFLAAQGQMPPERSRGQFALQDHAGQDSEVQIHFFGDGSADTMQAKLSFAKAEGDDSPVSEWIAGKYKVAGRGMTANKAYRGEVAEQFVLESLWRQFKNAGDGRVSVIRSLIDFREKFEISGAKVAWREMRRKLENLIGRLVQPDGCDLGDQERELFTSAIDLTNLGRAGFDIVDPFRDPVRMLEVKSVDFKNPVVHMITHEFHVAQECHEQYTIRLVEIPQDECDFNAYRWVDIDDPVTNLCLEQVFLKSAWGGSFHFNLKR